MFTYTLFETVILDEVYYCVCLLAVSVVSFGIGLLVGIVWVWI